MYTQPLKEMGTCFQNRECELASYERGVAKTLWRCVWHEFGPNAKGKEMDCSAQDRYSPLILKFILKVSKFHPQTSPLSLNPILRYSQP